MIEKKTILALEQALTLPYATERFAQLGWRVIRIENPGNPGQKRPGDPNRYIGENTGVDDLHAYFMAPNLGKEAITLNLKTENDQQILKKIVKELKVDVFMCNTLPKRYKQFGIDYDTLSEVNPELIWCGISAFGPDYPDRAGYDPALQAMLGFMHLTGEPSRDPMLCGLPLIDLKAGDEAFAQVLLAMLEQKETGKGKRIDISMAQCATSWLITALPQTKFAEDESMIFTRSGNEHRSFVPSNCYPSKDGYVYLAIGSDIQWKKLTQIEGFQHCSKAERETNNGRKKDKENVYADIRKGLELYTTSEFIEICLMNGLAVAPVNDPKQVGEIDFIKKLMVKTILPNGKEVKLFPAPMDTKFLKENQNVMGLPPRLGEHNEKIFNEAGIKTDQR
jgi:crotonobetainyl-CoA:carnitine CoA-transferase CaiB-like acyl-CoA transferase|tara:strand:+ start:468 stop:1646 length:1179 start_codon:yes stop_codon:yes gene_type:complete